MKVKTKNDIRVKFGQGKTEYGPGVEITLSGNDIARAIYLYLESQGVIIYGPRTIRYNGNLLNESGQVYVDPSGRVVANGIGYSGRGIKE